MAMRKTDERHVVKYTVMRSNEREGNAKLGGK